VRLSRCLLVGFVCDVELLCGIKDPRSLCKKVGLLNQGLYVVGGTEQRMTSAVQSRNLPLLET
jgi:hypothetical protein